MLTQSDRPVHISGSRHRSLRPHVAARSVVPHHVRRAAEPRLPAQVVSGHLPGARVRRTYGRGGSLLSAAISLPVAGDTH